MPTKIVARVQEVIPGDEQYLLDLDVNVLDDTLRQTIDQDFGLDVLLPADIVSGAVHDYVTQVVADTIMARALAEGVTLRVTRYEVMIPGWNSLRLSSVEDLFLVDDFVSNNFATGQIGELGWNKTLVGTGSVTTGSFDVDTPGTINVTTGTTNNSSAAIYWEAFDWATIGEMLICFRYESSLTSRQFTSIEVGVQGIVGAGGPNMLAAIANTGAMGGWQIHNRNAAGALIGGLLVNFGNSKMGVGTCLRLTHFGDGLVRLQLETEEGPDGLIQAANFPVDTSVKVRPYIKALVSGASGVSCTAVMDYFSLRGNARRG